MVAGEELSHEVYELEKVGGILVEVFLYVIEDGFA